MKTLYYFSAPWCGPCRRVAPVFDKIKADLNSEVEFIKVDVDAEPEKAQASEVRAVPTFQLLEDGVKVREALGLQTEAELREFIQG